MTSIFSACRCAILATCVAIGSTFGQSPLVSTSQPAKPTAIPIPIQDFIKHAEFDSISLSPDGKNMAVIARHRNRANLGIIDLDTRKLNWITNFETYDVYGYDWLDNDRVTLQVVDSLDDASGNIQSRARLAINTDGTGQREMAGYRMLRESTDKPGSVIVLGPGRSRGPDVFRLDTRTGQRELLTFENPGDVFGWVVDRKDEVRIAWARNKNIVKIYHRDNQKAPWVKIEEFDNRIYSIEPLAFDFDHRTLYVRSNKDRNKAALFKYDLDKRAIGELVAESENFDIGLMRFDSSKQKLVGIDTGIGGSVSTLSGVKWLDPDWDRVQQIVDSALPGRSNRLSWGGKVPHRVLVTSSSDTYPGGYFLLDTRTNKMERLAERRAWVDEERMSPMQRVQYAARDGLMIPAMLTLPKSAGGKSAKNLPLVVDIHGGPHAPGVYWGYNETAQFLSSRGYAVLQPSFRGSTGYGRKFLEAGYKQWGLAMQGDITDGVLWAIKQGYADPKRVCLMGASYGGYATLYGLIKEQGMFRCGIAAVAVTDLDLLFNVSWSDTFRSDGAQASMKERIGDPKADADAFKKISPLYQADKVSAPVLLFFGSDDRRVPLIHGEKFKAALDTHKKPYEWVVYTAEGHGFNERENRIDYWQRVEIFLGKHLGEAGP